jgi:surface protein
MPDFGIFRGFNDKLFGDKLYAGQRPAELGNSATFIFSVKTDNFGVSNSTQFRMPLTTSINLNMRVDWGDGIIENITNHTLAIHTYATSGTYTISVTGSILGWSFNNTGDRLKILNVSKWAGLNISVNNGFNGCANLTATAIDAPNITTNNLASYFQLCTNFNGAIGNWNVSNVTNMAAMFQSASSFNQNIGAWDVSKVTSFDDMFNLATVFNNGGFSNIDNWRFSTTNNITMFQVFRDAIAFNQPIGSWNTTRVINMQNMFLRAIFNQNIASWDVSNVTNMAGMFFSASAFNQPIGSWNTSAVTNMANMFQSASSFNQNIGAWNVSNVTNITNFMFGKTAANYSAANLDSIYNGWSSRAVKPNISITFGTIKYTALGVAGKLILTSAPNNWTITDGGI